MTWRVPVLLIIERNCETEADATRAAELAMECLPDGYGMAFVIGKPAQTTGVDNHDPPRRTMRRTA